MGALGQRQQPKTGRRRCRSPLGLPYGLFHVVVIDSTLFPTVVHACPVLFARFHWWDSLAARPAVLCSLAKWFRFLVGQRCFAQVARSSLCAEVRPNFKAGACRTF